MRSAGQVGTHFRSDAFAGVRPDEVPVGYRPICASGFERFNFTFDFQYQRIVVAITKLQF